MPQEKKNGYRPVPPKVLLALTSMTHSS